jgi:hypothetical protein
MNVIARPLFPRMSLVLSTATIALAQGNLTPPGPPGPTFKTLQEVEPRTPISSIPYTITAAGSYYVTTNLVPAEINQNGILVAANDVTIDLAGFALVGGGGSSGEGISASGARANIVIRNGTVRDWPGSGVNFYDSDSSAVSLQNIYSVSNLFTGIGLRDNSQATDCVADGNGSYGILARDDCLIERCRALSNGGQGIVAGDGYTIVNCTAVTNASTGILAGSGGTIRGCTARANKGTGFVVGDGSAVAQCASTSNSNGGNGFSLGNGIAIKDCTARGNAGKGISAGDGYSIVNCIAFTNGSYGIYAELGGTIQGCVARANTGTGGTGAGIRVGGYATVANCTVSGNAGDGIQFINNCQIVNNLADGNGVGGRFDGIHSFGARNRIDGNHAHVNTRCGINLSFSSIVDLVIRNSANGNATNYSFVSGASVGPLGTPSEATSPWANFVY